MVKKITNREIIKLYLNDYSRRMYLREIAEALKKPHQSIKPYVENLRKKNVLVEIKRKNLTEYKLNWRNHLLPNYIIMAEAEKTLSFIDEHSIIRILMDKIQHYFTYGTFIIFGSSAKNPKKSNDIDLLLIGEIQKMPEIKEFASIYSKKIHLIRVNKISDLSNALLIEIYKNHIILNNTEKTVRFFVEQYRKNRLEIL